MKRYVIAAGLVLTLTFGFLAVVSWTGWLGVAGKLLLLLLASVSGLAIAAAWMQALWPRRVLAGRHGFGQVRAGVASALLAVLLVPFGLAFLDRWLSDVVIFALAGFVAAVVVLAVHGGMRVGLCVQCDYDITMSLAAGRCPECGAAV